MVHVSRFLAIISIAALSGCGGGSTNVAPHVSTVAAPRSAAGVAGQSVYVTPSSLTFGSPLAANATFTATQNFSGDLTAVSSNLNVCVVNPPSASGLVDPTTGGQKTALFTVTPRGPGTCSVTVTDKKGDTAVVSIRVLQQYAYVADYANNFVEAINLQTNTVEHVVPVGTNPQAIARSPQGDVLYVANAGSNTVSILDIATNTVIATIAEGGRPDAVAFSPDGSKVFVANYAAGTVGVIDTASRAVIATIPNMGARPGDLRVSPDGSRLYVMPNDSTLRVADTTSNALINTIVLGNAFWGGNSLVTNSSGTRAYVASSFASGVDVVDTGTGTVIADIPDAPIISGTSFTPTTNTLAINSTGTKLYAAAYDSNVVTQFDLTTNVAVSAQPINGPPQYGGILSAIAISSDDARLYIGTGTGNVFVVDATTFTLLATIPPGSSASGNLSAISLPR